MGKKNFFGNFLKFCLLVNTGKFVFIKHSVIIYQPTLAQNVKHRNSRFTGKFRFWIQCRNLPVYFENSNFLPTVTGKLWFWNQQQNLPVNTGLKSIRTSSHGNSNFLPTMTGKLWFWIQQQNLPVNIGKKSIKSSNLGNSNFQDLLVNFIPLQWKTQFTSKSRIPWFNSGIFCLSWLVN